MLVLLCFKTSWNFSFIKIDIFQGILVTGGVDDSENALSSAEFFVLANKTWMPIDDMNHPRTMHGDFKAIFISLEHVLFIWIFLVHQTCPKKIWTFFAFFCIFRTKDTKTSMFFYSLSHGLCKWDAGGDGRAGPICFPEESRVPWQHPRGRVTARAHMEAVGKWAVMPKVLI